MKILFINSVCGIKSTGKICVDLAEELSKFGYECKIAYGREQVPQKYLKYSVKIGNDFICKIHGINARLFDGMGFGSKYTTKKFVEWIKYFNPDIIHLHNLHGYYINIKELFDYLKDCNKPIIWTLHDCWAFTGHCCYFDYLGCEQWKTECRRCKNRTEYPKLYGISRVKRNFKIKKYLFSELKNLTIITPSYWLANLVKKSYLKNVPIRVIQNGINVTTFSPTKSSLREKYQLNDKFVILGVAAVWDKRKGVDYFIKLSSRLPENFTIVLIGVEKKMQNIFPKNILTLPRINSKEELAKWYTLSDVFVNTTLEDNYPTTNLEAQACGTPCITFATGGSIESVPKANVVCKGDIDKLVKVIKNIVKNKSEIIFENEIFNISKTIKKYIQVYLEVSKL